MTLRFYFFSSLCLCLAFASCESNSNHLPDVSGIDVPLELVRYDKSLAAIDAAKPESSYLKLVSEYPKMTDLYFKQLTNLYDEDETKFFDNIKNFANDKRITTLSDTVNLVYKNTKTLEKDLTQSLKYLKYYFLDYKAPRFYTLFSEFSYQSFIFEDRDGRDAIGLGLDLFLGEDFDYKKIDPSNPAFSAYLTRAYNKDHLAKKAMEMIVEDLVGTPKGKRFVDLMVNQGKKQYLLEKLMPTVQDTVLWEYTPTQLNWVVNNELQIWDFFLDQNIIYETSHLKTSKYIQPAPNSKGMPKAAPGRTAVYIGYKIVSAYMDRHPKTTLPELLELKDTQLVLEKSRYKPAR